MDAVVVGKSDSIEYLDVTNLTKTPVESLWIPIFVNLKTVVITTNLLTESLLAEIGNTGSVAGRLVVVVVVFVVAAFVEVFSCCFSLLFIIVVFVVSLSLLLSLSLIISVFFPFSASGI